MNMTWMRNHYFLFKRRFRYLTYLIILAGVLGSVSSESHASQNVKNGSIIRDTEIEETLRDYITPIFKAANLNPDDLKIFLIASPDVNAAASMGPTLLVFSGLIDAIDSIDELMGVLAHETGHIQGNHVARLMGILNNTSRSMIASMVLGAAAAILSGRTDLGAGIMMAGMHVSEQNVYHYTRGHESSADQAAVRLLHSLGWSAQGLTSFLGELQKEELLSSHRQTMYRQTHPLSSDRIKALQHHTSSASEAKLVNPFPEKFQKSLHRMKAKLAAFLSEPNQMLRLLKPDDTSLEARYARAILLHRVHKPKEALAVLETLLRDYPKDPYFHELKGQILFENGQVSEALKAYEASLTLKPNAPLTRLLLAHVMLEMNTSIYNRKAIKELRKAEKTEAKGSMFWYLLATAYGRDQDQGMASLMLAEKSMLEGDKVRAIHQAKRALHLLKKTDRVAKQRADDIIHGAELA